MDVDLDVRRHPGGVGVPQRSDGVEQPRVVDPEVDPAEALDHRRPRSGRPPPASVTSTAAVTTARRPRPGRRGLGAGAQAEAQARRGAAARPSPLPGPRLAPVITGHPPGERRARLYGAVHDRIRAGRGGGSPVPRPRRRGHLRRGGGRGRASRGGAGGRAPAGDHRRRPPVVAGRDRDRPASSPATRTSTPAACGPRASPWSTAGSPPVRPDLGTCRAGPCAVARAVGTADSNRSSGRDGRRPHRPRPGQLQRHAALDPRRPRRAAPGARAWPRCGPGSSPRCRP